SNIKLQTSNFKEFESSQRRLGFSRLGIPNLNWIPACAGKTAWRATPTRLIFGFCNLFDNSTDQVELYAETEHTLHVKNSVPGSKLYVWCLDFGVCRDVRRTA